LGKFLQVKKGNGFYLGLPESVLCGVRGAINACYQSFTISVKLREILESALDRNWAKKRKFLGAVSKKGLILSI